jgi:two-component system, LytTR family, response regulator
MYRVRHLGTVIMHLMLSIFGIKVTGQMATHMSAYPPFASRPAAGIRVIVCEPDSHVREQLRRFIDADPVLTLAAESRDWAECVIDLDEFVPELLIVRSNLVPPEWRERAGFDNFPVVIALRSDLTSERRDLQHLLLPLLANPDAVTGMLTRAVRDIYDRKAKQLLYLVDRYVTGSKSVSGYRSALRVEGDGEAFELPTDKIMSIVAARKCVVVHAVHGQFMLREPIHQVATKLDPGVFVRIHRSIIVNREQLDRKTLLSPKTSHVILVNGTRYPVGPNYRDTLANAIKLSSLQ